MNSLRQADANMYSFIRRKLMKTFKRSVLILLLLFASFSSAEAGVSFTIGTDDFYLSVGDYDYLPYAFAASPSYVPQRISFYDALSDYGHWVQVRPFGQAWVPYASHDWRPYTYGRWIWTSHGWYWQGYEPWAWLAYHYGHWIWNSQFGWSWIPDYDWHPGHVIWAQGHDTIGWMPAPPSGYDYSRGYLDYIGEDNQFDYYDDDFGYYDDEDYSYGGPYYDPRYRDLYYNPNYDKIGFNLWIFIGNSHFGYDNYSDYYLDQDYTRYVFERRVIRISSRPVKRTVMERVIRQNIVEIPVVEKEIETEKKRVRVIVPLGGEEEKVRKNANRVVKEVIAPAFAEKQKAFKGEKSKNRAAVARIFKQENKQPKVQTVNTDVVIKEAEVAKKTRQTKRGQNVQREKQAAEQIEKAGKIHQSKKAKEAQVPVEDRDAQFNKKKQKKEVQEAQEVEEAAPTKKHKKVDEAQDAEEAAPAKKHKKFDEAQEAEEAAPAKKHKKFDEAQEPEEAAPTKKQKKVIEEEPQYDTPVEKQKKKKQVEEEEEFVEEAVEEEPEEEAVQDSKKDKSYSKKKETLKKQDKNKQQKSKKKDKEKQEEEPN